MELQNFLLGQGKQTWWYKLDSLHGGKRVPTPTNCSFTFICMHVQVCKCMCYAHIHKGTKKRNFVVVEILSQQKRKCEFVLITEGWLDPILFDTLVLMNAFLFLLIHISDMSSFATLPWWLIYVLPKVIGWNLISSICDGEAFHEWNWCHFKRHLRNLGHLSVRREQHVPFMEHRTSPHHTSMNSCLELELLEG